MGESGLIVGVSGLRGIVGESLTAEVAARFAQAVGAWFASLDPHEDTYTIVVGHDGRAGHEMVYHAVITGLLANGWGVLPIGRAMTPTIGVLVGSREFCAGGVVVTASHNPQEWNGIKVISGLVPDIAYPAGACAPTAEQANIVIERYEDGDFDWPENPIGGSRIRDAEIVEPDRDPAEYHVNKVERALWDSLAMFHNVEENIAQLRVSIDSVNASGSTGARALFERLRVYAVHLHGDDSGIFPHTPEPTRENLSGEGGLCDAVPGLNMDVGFAQDPDADRLAVVDELGEYIGEEYTMVLCAMALMEARIHRGGQLYSEQGERRAGSPSHQSKGKPMFVVNLSTSRMIDDVAAHYGVEVVRAAVGEANVVEQMKRLTGEGRDVVLGGEGNGGVIWAQVTYVRDSLSGMALILSLMARTGKTVSELVSMVNSFGPTDEVKADGYTILKIKSDLASKADAQPVVEHLNRVYSQRGDCRVDLVDGIRIDWDELGVWAHVRASNTEAIMRVIVEAPSEGEAKRVALEIEGEIGREGTRD